MDPGNKTQWLLTSQKERKADDLCFLMNSRNNLQNVVSPKEDWIYRYQSGLQGCEEELNHYIL